MWPIIQVEWWRSLKTVQTKIAVLVVVGLSFLGFYQYANLDLGAIGGGGAWQAFGQATTPVGVLFPLIGAIAFGDRLASDARTGYLALLLMRISYWRLLGARLLVAGFGTVMVVVIGLVPAFLMAWILYPMQSTAFPGALVLYHAPDWVIMGSNLGTLCLASASWTLFVLLVVSAWVRNPYAVVGAPVVAYLLATVVLAPRFNPMVHADLLNYVPGTGPLWIDAAIWAAWGFLSIGAGAYLWSRRRELLG